MYTPETNHSFADLLRYRAETTCAAVGDWKVFYQQEKYRVEFYGNFHGWFGTVEEAVAHVPEYARDKCKQQIERWHVARRQMSLGI